MILNSRATSGKELFSPDDPVRISKDATYDPFGWNKPEPHPYAGKPGFYTGYRNSNQSSQVAVLMSTKETVFVEEKFLEPRKVKKKKEKEIVSNPDDKPIDITIIG